MLNFKTKIIILKRKQVTKYLALAIFFIAGFISVRATVKNVFSQEIVKVAKKKLPIYSVKRDDNKISISFDAAWGADDTEELLKILKDNEVKTTFFICGYWIDKYPEKVKKIYEEGHEIGNHSNTHPHGSRLTLEQNKEEIKKVHNKVKDLLGVDMILYRPPFGEYNDTVLNAAKELGYYTIQWDVDSLDWKEKGVDNQINQVLNHKHLRTGSIILFHNDAKYTPKALDKTIKCLKEKGYKIVPISELIHRENYFIDHEGCQCKYDE